MKNIGNKQQQPATKLCPMFQNNGTKPSVSIDRNYPCSELIMPNLGIE